ncbi:NAC domain-containing protein 68 [Prunus persica]|uniref:NAC domain-containing protein 68 n=1 Tax=Prunus persica TaxID=3760 RepID=UPI0009AB261F|nr:NAC domain-containing protein 68 [Prunus persica]
MANSRNVSLAFHFHPTDQEIIRSILYKMVIEREPLNPSYHGIVHDEDLFGTKEPWKIWEDYGRDQLHDQDLYFICQLKRINYCSSRTHRRIGCEGTWSQRVAPKLIYDGNPNPIGNVRKLRYKNPKSEHNAEWFLDEYSLFVGDEGHDQTTPGFDFVVCRLRKNHNKFDRIRASVHKKTNKAPQQIHERKRKSMNVVINVDDDDDEEVLHGCSIAKSHSSGL